MNDGWEALLIFVFPFTEWRASEHAIWQSHCVSSQSRYNSNLKLFIFISSTSISAYWTEPLSANRTSEQVSLLSDQSDLVGSVYHLWCFVSWLVDLCVCVFPHCCADWALVRRAELKLQFREGSVPEHLVWNHEPTPPPGFTGLVLTETFAHLPVNKPCFLPAFGSTCLVVSTET